MNIFGKELKYICFVSYYLIRPLAKQLFEQCGLDDPFGHFYNEMESWKLWELDINQARRTGIKTLAYEWLRQYVEDIFSILLILSFIKIDGPEHFVRILKKCMFD